MKTKHTQGEWGVRGNTVFINGTYKSVATVHVIKNYKDITFEPIEDVEAQANAKLIAAAPDLLEALKSLYNAIDSCIDLTPELLIKCSGAIKKAAE